MNEQQDQTEQVLNSAYKPSLSHYEPRAWTGISRQGWTSELVSSLKTRTQIVLECLFTHLLTT